MNKRVLAFTLAEELTPNEIDTVAGGPYTEPRLCNTHEFGPASDSEQDPGGWDF